MRRAFSRLDPAAWSDRAQVAALVAMSVLAAALAFAPGDWRLLILVLIPVAGAFIWRFEGTHVREIALLQIPVVVALLIAHVQPVPLIAIAAEILAVVLLALIMFSDRFKRRWLALVAPGRYRFLSPAEQAVHNQLRDIYFATRRQIKRASSSDPTRVLSSIKVLESRARSVTTTEPHWARVRETMVVFLQALARSISAQTDEALKNLETARRDLNEATSAALDARELPLR
jgi:hypothetical protein